VPRRAAKRRCICGRSSSRPNRDWGCVRQGIRYLLIASPAGAYFKGGISPSVSGCRRSTCGQPGRHRRGQIRRQYAASLLAQAQAASTVATRWCGWTRRAPFRRGDGRYELVLRPRSGGSARLVTPELSGSLLPGITRDSLLQLAIDAGFSVERAQDRYRRVAEESRGGRDHRGVRLCTAAVITPVSEVKYGDGDFTIADGEPGEVTMALRDTLTGIQRGTFADTHGWMARLG